MRPKMFRTRGAIVQTAMLATALIAFISLMSFLIGPVSTEPRADMRIEPRGGSIQVDDTFRVRVLVTSEVPTNVFKGEIRFDPSRLSVESIDYNTSIADLWAEKPWYENGDGTINFIGGTTQKGGFLGTGTLMTITFRAKTKGDALLHLEGARILEHNGLGTDAVVREPIDTLFTVEEAVINEQTVASPKSTTATFSVTSEPPSTDVNGDGKQTIVDVSIFMLNILGDNPRFDFNRDGAVDSKDLSILMSAQ